MSDHLAATRTSYNAIAESYDEVVTGLLEANPMERGMLGIFAELVQGPVVEIGCGTGRITAYLDSLGVSIYGIDLSPKMLERARERYPALRFEVGSMTDLDLPDGELGGLVAWYSIFHTPPAELPEVLAGFHRVLADGGRLLIGTHAGDEHVHRTEAYGQKVSYDSYFLPPDHIAGLVREAGFTVTAEVVEPGNPGRYHATVFAQRVPA